MIKGMEKQSYKESLRELGLLNLEKGDFPTWTNTW